MHIVRDIAGNIFASSLGRIISILGPLVLVPMMINAWGMQTYGEWLILTAIPAYIMLSPDLGIAGAVVNRMAHLTAQGRMAEAVRLYRTAWLILVLASSAFVCLGSLVAAQSNWAIFGVADAKKIEAAPLITWLCVRILIAQQAFLLSGIYKSARRNPRYGLYTSLVSSASLFISLVSLLLEATPLQLVVATVAVELSLFICLFVDSQRVLPEFTLRFEGIAWSVVRPYVVPGFGHAAMPFVNALQNQGVLLVIGAILGPVAVSVFQTTRVLSNGVKSVLSVLSSAIMLELAALIGSGKSSLVRRLLVRNAQLGFITAAAALLVIATFGREVFNLWLKNASVYEPYVVIMLFTSIFPFVTSSTLSLYLLSTNKVHFMIFPAIGVGLGCTVMAAGGAAWLGLSGATAAVLMWEGALAYVSIRVFCRHSSIQSGHWFQDLMDGKSLRVDLTRVVQNVARRLGII